MASFIISPSLVGRVHGCRLNERATEGFVPFNSSCRDLRNRHVRNDDYCTAVAAAATGRDVEAGGNLRYARHAGLDLQDRHQPDGVQSRGDVNASLDMADTQTNPPFLWQVGKQSPGPFAP